MTLDEKLAISCKAAELRKAGDEEGGSRHLLEIVRDASGFFRRVQA